MNKRSLVQSTLALALAAFSSGSLLAQDKPLKIGVTAGPHAQIFEQVKKVAEKDGLKIQIVEFSDYIQPNAALAAGDLDGNSYQHKPFLDQQVKDRGYKIVNVGYTVNFPIGIYSKNAKSPYLNLIAVREQDKDKPWVAKLVKAYQSETIRKSVQAEFKGAVLTGF